MWHVLKRLDKMPSEGGKLIFEIVTPNHFLKNWEQADAVRTRIKASDEQADEYTYVIAMFPLE